MVRNSIQYVHPDQSTRKAGLARNNPLSSVSAPSCPVRVALLPYLDAARARVQKRQLRWEELQYRLHSAWSFQLFILACSRLLSQARLKQRGRQDEPMRGVLVRCPRHASVREAQHVSVWQSHGANEKWKTALLGDFSGTNACGHFWSRGRDLERTLLSPHFLDFHGRRTRGLGQPSDGCSRSHLEHNSGSSRHPVRIYFDTRRSILI